MRARLSFGEFLNEKLGPQASAQELEVMTVEYNQYVE